MIWFAINYFKPKHIKVAWMFIVSFRSENRRLFGWEKGNITQRHTLVSILGFIHRTQERAIPVSEVCVKTFQCRRNFVRFPSEMFSHNLGTQSEWWEIQVFCWELNEGFSTQPLIVNPKFRLAQVNWLSSASLFCASAILKYYVFTLLQQWNIQFH